MNTIIILLFHFNFFIMLDYVSKKLSRIPFYESSLIKVFDLVEGVEVITDTPTLANGVVDDYSTDGLISANVPLKDVSFGSSPSLDDVQSVDYAMDKISSSMKSKSNSKSSN